MAILGFSRLPLCHCVPPFLSLCVAATGTGGFLLCNTGTEVVRSKSGMLTTVAYKIGDQVRGCHSGVDSYHCRADALCPRTMTRHLVACCTCVVVAPAVRVWPGGLRGCRRVLDPVAARQPQDHPRRAVR